MSLDKYLSLVNNNSEELVHKANEKRVKNYKNKITFSRNIFVPVTRQCRNKCDYCGFVSDDVSSWITPSKYIEFLQKAKKVECSEVLLTLGEKPETKYSDARDFLARHGYSSTVEYVNNFCEIALKEALLPHSNLGVLSFEELSLLKDSNASMGLMLENVSNRLMGKGHPHCNSPGKNPEKRLETIKNAGKLKIPFTTGILVGIGENIEERIESLLSIAKINKQYSHIQEVIIQNFNPIPSTPMADRLPPSKKDVLDSVALARVILPKSVNIQVPPNLNSERILDALTHGANDLGGISPVTIDFINPTMDWPEEKKIKELLEKDKYILEERLPVYPRYEKYLSNRIRTIIEDKDRHEKPLSP